MSIRWSRFGAVVCAMVGALCLTPALAATAKPGGAHTARAHTGAKGTSKHTTAAAKGQRVKPHATASTARKAGKPHAIATGSRPVNRATVHAQRKPVSAPHGAVRHATGKKPIRAGAGRAVKSGLKPVSKAHGPGVGKRTVRKAPALRAGHKKTAH